MMRGLWAAATGMTAQQTNIDVIAHNLANVNTVGFKASRADFQDLVYQTLREPGSATSESTQLPTGAQVGLGARYAAILLARRAAPDRQQPGPRGRGKGILPDSAARREHRLHA